MLCFTGILVLTLAALAGSPLLLADLADRRRRTASLKCNAIDYRAANPCGQITAETSGLLATGTSGCASREKREDRKKPAILSPATFKD